MNYFSSIDSIRGYAAKLAEADTLVNGICACTNLMPDEVYEITGGANLDIVLKAAALTGKCMEYEEAARTVLVHALNIMPPRKSPILFLASS